MVSGSKLLPIANLAPLARSRLRSIALGRSSDIAVLILGLLFSAFPRADQVCFVMPCVIAVLNRTNFPDTAFWDADAITFDLSLASSCGHRKLQKR
jgi:hypothetical protein